MEGKAGQKSLILQKFPTVQVQFFLMSQCVDFQSKHNLTPKQNTT
jgi:hypothetical protein